MKYEKMSELLKKQRKEVDKTIYLLADQVGITASYLSQVENGNKLPSKEVFFKLLYFLKNSAVDYQVFFEPALKLYADYKNISFDKLEEDFYSSLVKHNEKIISDMSEHMEAITNNHLRISKIHLDQKGDLLDYPYFDLKWLLEQGEFEVFYGRDYDIQNAITDENAHNRDRVLYSRLNDKDIKVIHSLIEGYISNTYPYAYKEDVNADIKSMLDEYNNNKTEDDTND